MSDDDVLLAGELALGVLDGDERAAALRRRLADPAFAAEVTRWQDRLAALHHGWPEAAAPDRAPVAADGGSPRGTTARWRAATAVASLVAAAALVLLVARPAPPVPQPPPPAPPPLVAALAPGGSTARPAGAVYDAASGTVTVIGAPLPPAGRSAELWAIVGDAPPRAIGLIARDDRARVTVTPALRAALAAGTTLAVSIEPAGGSPTGKPTGPVVASGGLVRL